MGRRPDPDGFTLREPENSRPIDRDVDLASLLRARSPKAREALLVEGLDLLDEADRRAIAAHLPGGSYEALAAAMGVRPNAAGPRYAEAVDRLVERVVWVAARERSGMSAPERQALGRVQFFGESAQEVARRLRLPEEAVKLWMRRDGTPSRFGG